MSEVFILNKNKRSILWPLLLIFIGLYLLADNLGLVSDDYLSNMWHYWPAVLIALGLSMLLKK